MCRDNGAFAIAKMCSSHVHFVYGFLADATNEYCRIGESTSMELMNFFCKAVKACIREVYLSKPTRNDTVNQMRINKERRWPGMSKSLDCLHWV